MNGATIKGLDAMTTEELTTLKEATDTALRLQMRALIRRPGVADREILLADSTITRAFLARVDDELFRRGA